MLSERRRDLYARRHLDVKKLAGWVYFEEHVLAFGSEPHIDCALFETERPHQPQELFFDFDWKRVRAIWQTRVEPHIHLILALFRVGLRGKETIADCGDAEIAARNIPLKK